MKAKEFIPNDGMKFSSISLDTYRFNGREEVKAIQRAMEIGYRLLGSTLNCENEGTVGEAARTNYMPRSELIVTSKLPGRHQKYREAPLITEESPYCGGFDCYDICLVCWPSPETGLYVETWQVMIGVKKHDMIRSIDVCNFLPEYPERLTKEMGTTPSVNQVELHPHFNQEEQRGWDVAHGIVDESWSPLGRANSVLQDPVVGETVKAHGKGISQIILR